MNTLEETQNNHEEISALVSVPGAEEANTDLEVQDDTPTCSLCMMKVDEEETFTFNGKECACVYCKKCATRDRTFRMVDAIEAMVGEYSEYDSNIIHGGQMLRIMDALKVNLTNNYLTSCEVCMPDLEFSYYKCNMVEDVAECDCIICLDAGEGAYVEDRCHKVKHRVPVANLVRNFIGELYGKNRGNVKNAYFFQYNR